MSFFRFTSLVCNIKYIASLVSNLLFFGFRAFGMLFLASSFTIASTSCHRSSGSLYIRFNAVNLFFTRTTNLSEMSHMLYLFSVSGCFVFFSLTCIVATSISCIVLHVELLQKSVESLCKNQETTNGICGYVDRTDLPRQLWRSVSSTVEICLLNCGDLPPQLWRSATSTVYYLQCSVGLLF